MRWAAGQTGKQEWARQLGSQADGHVMVGERVDEWAVDVACRRTGVGRWANGQRMVQWAQENKEGPWEWWVWAILGRHSLL